MKPNKGNKQEFHASTEAEGTADHGLYPAYYSIDMEDMEASLIDLAHELSPQSPTIEHPKEIPPAFRTSMEKWRQNSFQEADHETLMSALTSDDSSESDVVTRSVDAPPGKKKGKASKNRKARLSSDDNAEAGGISSSDGKRPTKCYRQSRSGEQRKSISLTDSCAESQSSVDERRTTFSLPDFHEVPSHRKVRLPQLRYKGNKFFNFRLRKSALADAFLTKIRASLARDVETHKKRVPSLQIIDCISRRWPPTPQNSRSWHSSIGDTRGGDRGTRPTFKTSHSAKELTSTFENGGVGQSGQLGAKDLASPKTNPEVPAIGKDPRPAKQQRPSNEPKKRSESLPLYNRQRKPYAPMRSMSSDDVSSITRRSTTSFTINDSNDSSTLSSNSIHCQDLRSSYRIQYRGGREWEDGWVDNSFPSMVRRMMDTDLDQPSLHYDRFQSGAPDTGMPLVNRPQSARSDQEFLHATGELDDSVSDRRFEIRQPDGPCSATGLPSIPNRSRDVYVPTVWQTRVSVHGDAAKRKWRLKRVWESTSDHAVVIDDVEPDYVVDESDLESALCSLLGVPEMIWFARRNKGKRTAGNPKQVKTDPKERTSKWPSDESSDDRWDSNNDADRPPVGGNAWQVQRVWDREGQVVVVEDEQSLNEDGMMDFFGKDEYMPMDSLVFQTLQQGVRSPSLDEADQGGGDSSGIKSTDGQASDRSKLSDNFASPELSEALSRSDHTGGSKEESESDDHSWCSSVLSDGHASFIEDEPLDEEEFERSLALEVGRDSRQDTIDLKLARKKLLKVERLIKDLVKEKNEKSGRTKENRRLQEKCVKYLSELSEDLTGFPGEEDEEVVMHAPSREAPKHKARGPVEIECNNVVQEGQKQRQKVDLKRKLQKTEKLLNRLVVDKGDTIKSTKVYKRLEEKRAGYMGELGMAYEPFDAVSECSTNRSDSDLSSFSEILTTSSLHSMLETMEHLDAIAEEDNGSCCSLEEKNRDLVLLQRKVRKVEKEFNKIKSEKGADKGRRTKKGQGKKTTPAGRVELGRADSIAKIFHASNKSNHSKDANSDIDCESSKHSAEGKAKTTPGLAYASAGKWASPLDSAPKNGETMLRLHSLNSVYL